MNLKSHDNASRPSDPDGDEARLRALFNETIEPATGPTLTKLAARAADVPERAHRTPLWLPRWAWKPTAAGFVVAAGALGAAFVNTRVEAPRPAESSVAAAHLTAPAPAPAASVSVNDLRRPAVPLADLGEDLESLELSAAGGDWESEAEDDDVFDSVYGPPSDANLDAWLYATSAVLEGGG
jgi:hypothetical protein